MALSADQKKFYENTLSVTKREIHGARGRDPGGARQSEGPSGGAPERAEGGAADVRRGLPAPGRPQRAGRGRIAGLSAIRGGRAAAPRLPALPGSPRFSRPPPRSPRAEPRASAEAAPRRPAPRRHARSEPDRDRLRARRGRPLVGVSEYSDYPEAARAIPRVGGLEVDAEKVAALRPDLVLAVAEGNARGAVRGPRGRRPSRGRGALGLARRRARRRSALVGERLGRREEAERLVAESRGPARGRARADRRPASGRGRSCSSGRTRRRPREAARSSTTCSGSGRGEPRRRSATAGPCCRRNTSRPHRSTWSSCPSRRRPGRPTSGAFASGPLSRGPGRPRPRRRAWTSRP